VVSPQVAVSPDKTNNQSRWDKKQITKQEEKKWLQNY
jgi:hypothetical protein